MKRPPFTDRELSLLADLWPTSMTMDRLEELFGATRKQVRWAAVGRLKLPARHIARAEATERYLQELRAA